jgi:hypothetical protein
MLKSARAVEFSCFDPTRCLSDRLAGLILGFGQNFGNHVALKQ